MASRFIPVVLSLLAAATLAAQVVSFERRNPVPQLVGTGAIEGVVVDSVTNEPIRKATVMLTGPAHGVAMSDVSGRFAFRKLPPGSFTIRSQAASYPMMMSTNEVQLADGEQKNDLRCSLVPGGTITGRVVDDEGEAVPRCMVGLYKFVGSGPTRRLQQSGGSNTDENGEYRISNVAAGKYYVSAKCYGQVLMPHPLMRRAPDDPPAMLAFARQLYPGSSSPAGATRVSVQPGNVAAGIDFHLVPASGITVRGRITAPPGSSSGATAGVVNLTSTDPTGLSEALPARYFPSTGRFEIPNVPPGSYDLVAMFQGPEGITAEGRTAVQVGDTPPEPIELALTPPVTLTGTVTSDPDSHFPLEHAVVMLQSLDPMSPMTPQQATVDREGAFTLKGVPQRKFRVIVSGAGYVKKMEIGDQEISGDVVDFSRVSGPLKILLSAKWPMLRLAPADTMGNAPMVAILWNPQTPWRNERTVRMSQGAESSVPQVIPGSYVGCILPLTYEQRSWDQNFQDQIQSLCRAFEIKEGDNGTASLPVVHEDDIKKLSEEQ